GRRGRWLFFASRRRHTRLVSDWSSDVCSSDLASALVEAPPGEQAQRLGQLAAAANPRGPVLGLLALARALVKVGDAGAAEGLLRSEERRVGEGCGARGVAWSAERKKRGRQGGR